MNLPRLRRQHKKSHDTGISVSRCGAASAAPHLLLFGSVRGWKSRYLSITIPEAEVRSRLPWSLLYLRHRLLCSYARVSPPAVRRTAFLRCPLLVFWNRSWITFLFSYTLFLGVVCGVSPASFCLKIDDLVMILSEGFILISSVYKVAI